MSLWRVSKSIRPSESRIANFDMDHHSKTFDDGTQTKLIIYGSYLRAWIKVFTHTRHYEGETLSFFDFFSGPGKDPDGTSGSPAILMDELLQQRGEIFKAKRGIQIYFNDRTKRKTKILTELCQEYNMPWVPTINSKEFAEAYLDQIDLIGTGPSLVFLDQCGVKHVNKARFQQLASKSKTDILFFFASTHQKRFNEQFDNDLDIPTDTPVKMAHRAVADQYRSWAPEGYYVGDYSIRKENGNVYGLIFGSGHRLGMFKFLQTVWNDRLGGDANFHMEASKMQGDLFGGFEKTKLELLQDEIRENILIGVFQTDADVVNHCLSRGILPSKAAKPVFSEMRKSGEIFYQPGNAPRTGEIVLKEIRKINLKNGW